MSTCTLVAMHRTMEVRGGSWPVNDERYGGLWLGINMRGDSIVNTASY